MSRQMETFLRIENQQEAVEVMQLLNEMSPAEKKEMLIFLQGMKFAKELNKKSAAPTTAQPT